MHRVPQWSTPKKFRVQKRCLRAFGRGVRDTPRTPFERTPTGIVVMRTGLNGATSVLCVDPAQAARGGRDMLDLHGRKRLLGSGDEALRPCR